jgi:hypothetical protein
VRAPLSPAGDWFGDVAALIRQGLLSEAEARLLAAVPDSAPLGDRGWAELLAGNIDYERGEFLSAQEHYLSAEKLLAQAGQDAGTATQNIELVGDRLVRSAALGEELAGLQLAVVLAAAVGLLCVGVLARRSV